MIDYRAMMALLGERAATVREFAGSSPTRAFLELLDSIEASYFDDLRSVKADGLERLQGQLAQIQAIRDVLMAKPTNGRV